MSGGNTGLARLHLALRGGARPSLPIGEALHPVAIAAALVLLANDWLLKSSAAPVWLTGKLSDVAGLVFAPVALTAVIGLALWLAARLGAKFSRKRGGGGDPGGFADGAGPARPRGIDPWLTRRRLGLAVGATGAVFAVVKLWPGAAARVAAVWGELVPGARIVPDPLDLIALPALAIAWWIGASELRWIQAARAA